MTDTFSPPRAPSVGTTKNSKLSVISTRFGDGYVQDSPNGIMPPVKSWTLTWDPILKTEAATIETWLDAHNGKPFSYTLPGELTPRTLIETGTRSLRYGQTVTDGLTISVEERLQY